MGAWLGIDKSHKAFVVGLHTMLDQLLQKHVVTPAFMGSSALCKSWRWWRGLCAPLCLWLACNASAEVCRPRALRRPEAWPRSWG